MFLDSNGNGVFDPGETPVSGAQLMVNGSRRGAPTDVDGTALVPDVLGDEPSDVAVLGESLQDPTWLAPRAARRIVARGGGVATVDLPLIVSGEVTGTVVAREDRGLTPVPGVRLELVETRSGRSMNQVVSGFDGFYDITGVPPGDYVLRLAAAPGPVLAVSPRDVHIAPTGTIDDGLTYVWATVPATAVDDEDAQP